MRIGFCVVALVACMVARAAADPAPAGISFAEAKLLFPGAPESCTDIPCLIDAAYAKDAKAKTLALALFRDTGDVAGVGPDEIMDGGYRGKIHLVPELPQKSYRDHLAWTASAMTSIDAFFTKLYDKRAAPPYRWRGVKFRFVRSVGKRTPSAYALGFSVTYNVEGSLLTSAGGVLETLFHELFHSNDGAHGQWTEKNLQKDYDGIVAKCGAAMKCLAPYAPNSTVVRGGTYYAFQQNNGNGVHEYGAELAVRYWREQNEMMTRGKLSQKAFKCGPAENARAWKLLVDEFFAGRDLVPGC